MTLDGFIGKVSEASYRLKEDLKIHKRITHVTDVDADGIVSAYGIDFIGKESGCSITRVFIDRPFETVLEHIYRNTEGPVIITDHGAEHRNAIIRLADETGRNTTVIDHHGGQDPSTSVNDRAWFLNSNDYGINGDKEASSSTITYLFVKNIAPYVKNHAQIFLLGSVGDGNLRKNLSPAGIDEMVANECRKKFFVQDDSHPKPPRIILNDGYDYDAREIALTLTRMGFWNDDAFGPQMAMKIVEEGYAKHGIIIGDYHSTLMQDFNDTKKSLFKGIKCVMGKHSLFFDTGHYLNAYRPKVIGDFANWLMDQARFPDIPQMNQPLYVLAAMPLDKVRLLGARIEPYLDGRERIKVSVRLTPTMLDELQYSKAPSVVDVIKYLQTVKMIDTTGHNSHNNRGAFLVERTGAGLLGEFVDNLVDKP